VTPAARLAASAEVLDAILGGEPAERALLRWSRGARYAGSKDRAAVRDHVFDGLRRQRSLAWLGGSETGRGLVLGALRAGGTDPATLMTGEGHALPPPRPDEAARSLDDAPEGVRLDVPDWLLPRLRASLGEELDAACAALQERAPIHLRANLARTTRDAAARGLAAEGIAVKPVPGAATALVVTAGAAAVARSRAYLDGAVELQDASSQAAVLALPLRDGDRVLDLCAGGGGKTLAMGARARLHLHAHDAEPRRMADLPSRAARAGIEVEVLADPASGAPFDLVLVDAPCSGSGTWRRAPDAKWRLTPERLAALVKLQGDLIDGAARLVGPGGHLAFATCSVLEEEGPLQVAAFLGREAGWTEEVRFATRPGPGGDGFFQAVLRRSLR
jgi:16S rRNA (cytosine967-C5)-methyltransferase